MTYRSNSQGGDASSKSGLIVFVLVLAAIAGGFTFCARGIKPDYSTGTRAGTVSKFSQKGLYYKSWEGELVQGGMRQGEGSQVESNVFKFSVADPKVVADVQKALEGGQRATLHYRQWMKKPMWQDSDYEVTKVDVQSTPTTPTP